MLRISWLFCIFRYSPQIRFGSQNGGNFPTKIWQKYKIFQKFTLLWAFTEFDIIEKYRKSFQESERQVYSVFPFELYGKDHGPVRTATGDAGTSSVLRRRSPLWSPEGVHRFLTGSWVEHLNGEYTLPDVLLIMINPSFPITNYKIVMLSAMR